ncbi:MAG TPA: hydrogen gas-evolving membrane-bound hydrogenase subunit E [Caldilineaceae bacterium]|nr:hydrogen gas-evolving membrane-bound hydrogenase subunit E [Caldilineaceae bacterium]
MGVINLVSPLGLSLLVLTLTGLLFPLVRPSLVRRHEWIRHIGWLAALPPAAVAWWLMAQLPAVTGGQVLEEQYPWAPQLGLALVFRLDGLALFFGLIITVIGAAVALYTSYYLEGEPRTGYFYSQLFLFMASMLGLVWADNLLLIFVFWELTSITSYLLIGFRDDEAGARNGARRAFVVTSLGGLAMLFGMVMLGAGAGVYTLHEILVTPGLTTLPYYPAALALILLGAFTKSAQVPFHFWLPGAMAAPTPASAYLHSATMVKAGVYLLARLHPALSDDPRWFWPLLLAGGATMLLGAVAAMGQFDIKALLAYATVSQLGILVMLLAFPGADAATAVVVGILAHALYKGPLFLVAGIVDHAAGTRDLRRLGTLARELPIVAAVALLAGLSMSGLPFLFGFVSKETFLETLYHYAETAGIAGWIAVSAAAVAGAFFMAYSLTLLWEAFFRGRAAGPHPAHVHHAPSFAFVLPPLALTLLGTAFPFILSQVEGPLLAPAASAIYGEPVGVHLALWHGWTPVFLTSLAALATGVLLFWARDGVRALLRAAPAGASGAPLFDRVLYAIYGLARWVTVQVQGGTLAQQVIVMLSAAVLALAVALSQASGLGDFRLDWSNWPHVTEVVLALLAVVAAVVTVRAQSRLSAIISIGVVGVVVTVYFVFFNAPDLALTQLLVDILTVVLLVLVFYRIPPSTLPPISGVVRMRNLVTAGAVGVFGFFLVLFAVGAPFAPPISDYFSLNAAPLAHGGNIVNVILVDFRGFDTLGEITVLAIAAVGGYSVLRAALFWMRPVNRPESLPESDREAVDEALEQVESEIPHA